MLAQPQHFALGVVQVSNMWDSILIFHNITLNCKMQLILASHTQTEWHYLYLYIKNRVTRYNREMPKKKSRQKSESGTTTQGHM